MIKKRKAPINSGERGLLLIGLGGLVLVSIIFIVAIAIVARLEPTTGPTPNGGDTSTPTTIVEPLETEDG